MKKAISILLLAGSLILTGCGDTKNDFSQVSGQQGNPGPIVTPTPQPTAGYFVDAANGNDTTAAAAANPTSDTPFKTIQAAVADAPENTTITVRAGSYTGAVTLKNGQRLLGVASGNRPVLDNTITLADGNTVDFLRIANSPGAAIDGDDQNGGTITNCEIESAGSAAVNEGFRARSATGRWVVTGNTISNVSGLGIDFRTDGAETLTALVNDNTITNSAFNGIGFVAEDTSQVRAQVTGNSLTGNGTNATVEIIVTENSNFGLDLEDNQNDDVYSLYRENTGAVFQVEQLSTLTASKPAGAGNTGTVDIASGPTSSPVTEVPNGTFTF